MLRSIPWITATQQNATMAEENTAASSDLAAQASSLRLALASLKLDRNRHLPFKPTENQQISAYPTTNACFHPVCSLYLLAIGNDWQEF